MSNVSNHIAFLVCYIQVGGSIGIEIAVDPIYGILYGDVILDVSLEVVLQVVHVEGGCIVVALWILIGTECAINLQLINTVLEVSQCLIHIHGGSPALSSTIVVVGTGTCTSLAFPSTKVTAGTTESTDEGGVLDQSGNISTGQDAATYSCVNHLVDIVNLCSQFLLVEYLLSQNVASSAIGIGSRSLIEFQIVTQEVTCCTSDVSTFTLKVSESFSYLL